jgi:hypothetical protein
MCRRTEQVSTLVRDELKLAQIEMSRKGKQAGLGPGLLGGGLIAVYGVGCLIACAIIGLSPVVQPGLGALIVGVALLAIAVVAALLGKGGKSLFWTTCAAARQPAAQPTPPTATRSPAHTR